MRNVYLYPFSKYAESCLPQYIMCWECEVKGIPKSPVIIYEWNQKPINAFITKYLSLKYSYCSSNTLHDKAISLHKPDTLIY